MSGARFTVCQTRVEHRNCGKWWHLDEWRHLPGLDLAGTESLATARALLLSIDEASVKPLSGGGCEIRTGYIQYSPEALNDPAQFLVGDAR